MCTTSTHQVTFRLPGTRCRLHAFFDAFYTCFFVGQSFFRWPIFPHKKHFRVSGLSPAVAAPSSMGTTFPPFLDAPLNRCLPPPCCPPGCGLFHVENQIVLSAESAACIASCNVVGCYIMTCYCTYGFRPRKYAISTSYADMTCRTSSIKLLKSSLYFATDPRYLKSNNLVWFLS